MRGPAAERERQRHQLAGGHAPEVVHVVGGAAANALFCQLVADACQLPVIAGPTEAAAWGNVLSQVRALGAVPDDRASARALIRRSEGLASYSPRSGAAIGDRLDQII